MTRRGRRPRISVHKVRCKKSPFRIRAAARMGSEEPVLHGVSLVFQRIIEVYHPHGDPVLRIVHCTHSSKLIRFVHRVHNGKIEIIRLRKRAGDNAAVLRFQADIFIMGVIPRYDGGIVLPVAPSVQVDADGAVREHLAVCNLRRDISVILRILQLIVIAGLTVRAGVFRKAPERRVDLAADPFHGISGVIAADERPVVIHGIELIALGRIVPYTGVDNDLLAVINIIGIGDADLLCRI